ncbi:methionyl-tRNA formyltransferase [Methylorubrum rhodesianum]|jgi:methionyl-tRNA formyltransferase|uniref:Methionyl-tRNA formyltransferase n=1 Tax=Methylorubrum rhodesianum TaxID=29427 RepID=A0ABU9ZA42_9HYPH|nr:MULTISPECIES: methionyl-tRNA formyltransferase [Methylorubrum]MBB5763222.1 methionyl-tRNA formyltransferase [Methylorubrum rhodesianum]MBI1689050.1 methionyl-tRNA formyltransferase [Methylorubrum sp. DB1722]MBK3405903.1 methionyl-tRNA formyltransferase [Methylorubrum rhodesianum]MBY0142346.1 methionyl-tRNA formyltransferase [Methylorubrum populi]
MRIVFMGTPDFAVPTLDRLHADGHSLAAVYTRAPAKAGRGMALKPSPVHARAEALGIPVLTPATLKSGEAAETFAGHGAEVAVVVAYGMLLPQTILDAPRFGCLNLHGSLLPRWRGAAPIQRAVMAGDAESGVGVMRMEAGLDTGPVAMEARVPISEGMTAGELHDALMPLGADLMGRAIRALGRDGLTFTPQSEEGVVYAHKITNEEARIDWSRPAAEVARHINGLSPFPGAYFEADLGKGPERVKVLRALAHDGSGAPGTLLDAACTVACGTGAVRLLELRRAGKGGVATGEDFLRGARLAAGASFA